MQNIRQFARESHIRTLILLIFINCASLASSVSAANADDETASSIVVKIGNPNLTQYPSTNANNNSRRSVWDMYFYKDRIYLGGGDYVVSSPSVHVWSFGADGNFTKEYITAEEQIHIFREYEGKLYVPGIDAKESWLYGNLYVKDGGWQKLRTIPNGVHVFDVAFLERDIYVTMSSSGGYTAVMKSSDMGQTWLPIIEDTNSAFYRGMAASGGSLFILGYSPDSKPSVYRYTSGNTETLAISLRYGTGRGAPHSKITAFGDGVIYMVNMGMPSAYSSSLMFLKDLAEGPVSIEEFEQKRVRDVFVRDGISYVLVAEESGDEFDGSIYSSDDLDIWNKLVEFSVPEKPQSFELLDGVFYVGLGSRTAESGSIYRLDIEAPPIEPPPWDVDRDGVVGIPDFVILGQHFGKTLTTPLEPDPDVNSDGKVDIFDVILVGQHFGETYLTAMPSRHVWKVGQEHLPDLIEMYDAICNAPNSDPAFLSTKQLLGGFIFNTEIAETRAFQNYPNPSNPDTWIPYQLANDAYVTIEIYDLMGGPIRSLDLGHKPAGFYLDSDQAAYWDGMNNGGEEAASGVYFYRFTAGDFVTVGKLVIVR